MKCEVFLSNDHIEFDYLIIQRGGRLGGVQVNLKIILMNLEKFKITLLQRYRTSTVQSQSLTYPSSRISRQFSVKFDLLFLWRCRL